MGPRAAQGSEQRPLPQRTDDPPFTQKGEVRDGIALDRSGGDVARRGRVRGGPVRRLLDGVPGPTTHSAPTAER